MAVFAVKKQQYIGVSTTVKSSGKVLDKSSFCKSTHSTTLKINLVANERDDINDNMDFCAI